MAPNLCHTIYARRTRAGKRASERAEHVCKHTSKNMCARNYLCTIQSIARCIARLRQFVLVLGAATYN